MSSTRVTIPSGWERALSGMIKNLSQHTQAHGHDELRLRTSTTNNGSVYSISHTRIGVAPDMVLKHFLGTLRKDQ